MDKHRVNIGRNNTSEIGNLSDLTIRVNCPRSPQASVIFPLPGNLFLRSHISQEIAGSHQKVAYLRRSSSFVEVCIDYEANKLRAPVSPMIQQINLESLKL